MTIFHQGNYYDKFIHVNILEKNQEIWDSQDKILFTRSNRLILEEQICHCQKMPS